MRKYHIPTDLLQKLLGQTSWNIKVVANQLGIPRTSLNSIIKRAGLQRPNLLRELGAEAPPIAPGEAIELPGLPVSREEFSHGRGDKGSKHRVLAVGDLHEPFAHTKYLQFVREVYDEFNCDTVVFVGDIVDNHAISYHEHNPNGLSPGDELKKAIKHLGEWAKVFPKAYICIGNHDELVFRKAVTHGLPKEVFKDFNEIYQTPKEWEWRLSWEIDSVLYQHGTGSSGENAHKLRALKNRQSTVIGHIHSHGGAAYMASNKDLIFGLNTGCGINLNSYAMIYGKDFVNRPTLGCGVVLEGKHAFFIPMDLGTKIRWLE